MLDWRWDFTWSILPQLLVATGNTLLAAGTGYVIALFLGLIFALAQRTPFRLLTVTVREIMEFIRSTPSILQIFFVFYVAPQFGIRLSPWTSGMIAIGLHYAAYLSEVYRGGLESVPTGQWEAATSLNLSISRTYFRIIIPQALPPSLAGMGNCLVGIFKETPILSVIGVVELMHTANAIGSENYRYLEPYTLVGLIFLIISLPSATAIRMMDVWVGRQFGISQSTALN
ncbi:MULTISPECIES: ectoine/hydroxyectoine ABC transporter permease subunit EhuD [unclassified Mesorhizobium]|uniref:ectoine/hydroxyectoine ABC transporter permease subunit EhuD n=1 Tax=unclassified Mesorhizobium TaxID=325217 RepID=UPI000FD5A171|nr:MULTISPECIES: ectoine/hydroxyectoine ABC transporter permease subunit EhuD [unclassified Mesorhizobium]RUW21017.1 ectoine/hydroxyectoine ABC transporter permease subunit EhuD [Mesorhizobium sp. M4B.F.Ca.ET.013.02.1.1]TGV18007.1 ectoine/hydroxyectoine ABC transporter permease subunit EhuD [Mesorhizobium sp. M4B.F.Ca.ET.143.01.1.1]